MKFTKIKTVFAYFATTVIAGLVGSAGIVHADPPATWSQDVYRHLDYLATAPDGKVAVTRCNYGSNSDYDLKMFSSSGNLLGTHTRSATESLTACGNNVLTNNVITADGIVVGNLYDSTAWTNYSKAAAYSSSGSRLWTYTYPNLCGSVGRPFSPQNVAADGSIFFTMESRCSSGAKYELVNLNATTGATNFHVGLAAGSERLDSTAGLRPYSDGYVYYDQGATEFVYLNASGVKDTSRSFVLGNMYYNKPVEWALGATGKLSIFVAHNSTSGSCNIYDTSYLFTKVPGQSLQTFDYGICPKQASIRPMPGGETIIYTSNNKNLYKIDNDGSVVYDISMAAAAGVGSSILGTTIAVDTQGNVLANVIYTTPGASVNASKLLLFNPAGTVISRFETNSFLQPNQINNKAQIVKSIGLVNGNIYLLISDSTIDDAKLHKVPFAKISIDYPRGAILGDVSVPGVRNYVALGDSFSSGESVAPFITGTDVSGTNECHRSPLAYPRLLAEDPTLEFTLASTAFAACSGAVVSNITTAGQWSESKQIDAITANTDLVTLTIGGNDVPFNSFATSCVTSVCNLQSVAYSSAVAGSQAVETSVGSMLDAIEAKLDNLNNTTARVLVIGYPDLLPDPTAIPLANECSAWLIGTEPDAIGHVQFTLNTSIKEAVEDRGAPFEYVSPTAAGSPFIGHELCRNDSGNDFFNGVVVSPQVYSFHPNQKGQAAYAKLIKDYLLAHS